MALYESMGAGDGFALIKKMHGDSVHSYIARQLSSGEERLLILRDSCLPEDFDEACRIGPYCFSASVLKWIEEQIRLAIAKGVTPIYLDEVGKLEMMNKGYDALFREVLEKERDIYVTIREDLIEAVVAHYHISSYTIITPD